MNIGFISTRLAGTDGVSLETAKLANICRRLGHRVFYCAGQLDADSPPGMLVPEMHFTHQEARWIHDRCFGTTEATPDLSTRIASMARWLKSKVGEYVDRFEIDVLVVENALTIPMNVSLGVALSDFIAENGVKTISHNHDFYWERERFIVNCIPEILQRVFPPVLPTVRHLVINSLAQASLRSRLGLASEVLPNIFDYSSAAPGITDRNRNLRSELGLTDRHLLILQPTRVIPRKAIESSIELVRILRLPQYRSRLQGKSAVLVISHQAGDEGMDTLNSLHRLAAETNVPLVYAGDRFRAQSATTDNDGRFLLWDAYIHADFVTYPSKIEGFGNALLEAVYFRLPLLVNRYAVYAADIAPKGFAVIEIDGEVTPQAAEECVTAITDPVHRRRLVEHNYEVARQHYSFEAAGRLLASFLTG